MAAPVSLEAQPCSSTQYFPWPWCYVCTCSIAVRIVWPLCEPKNCSQSVHKISTKVTGIQCESGSNVVGMQFIFSTNVLRRLRFQYEASTKVIPTVWIQYKRSTHSVCLKIELDAYHCVFYFLKQHSTHSVCIPLSNEHSAIAVCRRFDTDTKETKALRTEMHTAYATVFISV